MANTPVPDGQASFEGGQNASLPPHRLEANQFAAGVNLRTEKGVIRPRYGYERKQLTFPSGGYSYRFNKVINFKTLFEGGKFQALVPYEIGNKSFLVVVISGVIFLIDTATYNVKVLTRNTNTQLNETAPRINWSDAGKYIVLYDFPSRPIIIEELSARRSDVDKDEIPTANLGVFNQSRLFFANKGNEFSAGDPVGNDLTPNAPVTAVEILLPGSPYFADIYSMPSQHNNPITAMATLQGIDDSTGIGQLLTFTKEEAWAYNTKDGRDTWLAGKFGTSVSDKAGQVGPRAGVNVNSDYFFVSGDNQLRSLSAARDEQRKWARVPMSTEVDNWKKTVSPDLLQYNFLTYFKNKIFWSVRPYRIPAAKLDGTLVLDVAHRGLLVLETDNVSRLGTDSAPAWAGLWTGIRPMDMCVTNQRMFSMGKEYYSNNALYEIDPELSVDRTTSGKRRQIQTILYTREHYFNELFKLKSLQNIELDVTGIEGAFELGVDFKPSHSSNFLFWTNFKHKNTVAYTELCGSDVPEKRPLAFRELKFGIPDFTGLDPSNGNPVTRDTFDKIKKVQFRITLKGDKWQFNQYKIDADIDEENKTETLPDNLPDLTQESDCYSDWYYEEFGL